MFAILRALGMFVADLFRECFCPRCRVIRLCPLSWRPKISMGLTPNQLRLECIRRAPAGVGLVVRKLLN